MSTTATKAPHLPPSAPWRQEFVTHLQDHMQSPEFVLSTLHPVESDPSHTPAATTSNKSPTPYVPRARYCIYRGMWATLPPNKHNDAERNPAVFEADCPTFTTDMRMQKVPELFGSGAGHAERAEQVKGSGGGGPVEAVWWVKDKMTQWRVKGHAWVVGPDVEGAEQGKESSGVRSLKGELGKRMRVVGEEGKVGEWSWLRELRGHFGNVSPGMRGSFKQPPPGQPVSKPHSPEEKMGEKVTDLDDSLARSNFRVAIIVPDEVERTELTDPETSRRLVWTFDDGKGVWSEATETWP